MNITNLSDITSAQPNEAQRLSLLNDAIEQRADVCSSQGTISHIPQILRKQFFSDYIGIIVCLHGEIELYINGESRKAGEGDTVFLSENILLQIPHSSDDLLCTILLYRIAPIRDILGSTILMMRIYDMLNSQTSHIIPSVDNMGFMQYTQLLRPSTVTRPSEYGDNEQKLLQVSLTYRLCDFFSSLVANRHDIPSQKLEIFGRLISLIGQFYNRERSVIFYADRLCLSPKYLSSLVKSVCGYTVQQLVFKALVRRSIFLINSTNKNIQEIAAELGFPNASAFGTFFKKQTGLSPRHYKRADSASGVR